MIRAFKNNIPLYVLWTVCMLSVILSVMTTPLLSAFAFGLVVLAMLFRPLSESFCLLFGLLPLANAFKLEAGSTSLFTVCEIVFVLLLLMRTGQVKTKLVLPILLLTVYTIIFSYDNLSVLIIAKFVAALLLISYATAILKQTDVQNIAYLVSLSTLATMLLSGNSVYYRNLSPYYEDVNYYSSGSEKVADTIRISGFFGDPNFCSILIITVLAFLCVLYYYKHIGVEFWLLGVPLTIVGLFTYSKSYFLCIAVLIAALVFLVLFPRHRLLALVSVFGVILLIGLAFSGRIEVFNMILARFDGGDVTTGRFDLNGTYMNYVFGDLKRMLFGDGLPAEKIATMSRGVHNTYLEALFKLGIVGSVLYLIALYGALCRQGDALKSRRKSVNYIPLAFLLVMLFFLPNFLHYGQPFYIILVMLSFNCRQREEQTDVNEVEKPLPQSSSRHLRGASR